MNYNVWQYYQGEAQAGFNESYARLNSLVNKIPPSSTVLNIGVGDGSFEKLAIAAGHKVYSLDPDQNSIDKLIKEHGVHGLCGTIDRIDLESNTIDVVVVSEVLEHLTPEISEKGLKECKRVLKTSGFLLGTVPADENLGNSIVACPCCGERFHRWGHQQSFSEISLKELLSGSFADVKVTYRKFIPWGKRSLVYKLSGALKILVVALGIKVENSNYLFEAR